MLKITKKEDRSREVRGMTLQDVVAWVTECANAGITPDTVVHGQTKGIKMRLVELSVEA